MRETTSIVKESAGYSDNHYLKKRRTTLFDISKIGWNQYFSQQYEMYKKQRCKQKKYYETRQFDVARVMSQQKNHYSLMNERGEIRGILRKVFLNEVTQRSDLPAVGDWVVLIKAENSDDWLIDGVLERKSKLSRIAAGTPGAFDPLNAKNQYAKLDKGEQVLCANIDTAFIVSSLNQDFNLRRLERYLAMVWDGGIIPCILLTKSDLCSPEEIEDRIDELSSIAYGVPCHVLSSIDGTGMDQLNEYLKTNQTMVLIGSSGVGKSTLINTLLGYEKMTVKDITRYKDKGQHTTTHKEMIFMEQGGMIIDTPGMRELRLTGEEAGLKNAFGDVLEEIEALSQNCKFKDCQHTVEPGCAVKEALETGELSQERWHSYQKLLKEIKFQEKKQKTEAVKNSLQNGKKYNKRRGKNAIRLDEY
ncbi:MAG TPA: ribosome small subunit-dependent GTPase A [Thermotogota bacterium]|nr:ribosome small subunit-dependent GTPase A [Thermotogota bacterium]HRW35337.1 ribosome small subunit-dependent GTPase A [Thermotogota bacterium]